MNAARLSRLELRTYFLALSLLIILSSSVAGADWPQFRGRNHDGISTERLNKQWTGSVTNPVWRVALTNCIGSVTVSGGRVFTQTRRDIEGANRETCVALNATNGMELWAAPVDLADYPNAGVGYDDGPRTTPAVYGDSVFVLSSYLKLFRMNVTNGAVIWEVDLVDVYDANVIPWQNAASPVIENGLIYVNSSCPTSSIIAFRTGDGSVAWRSQNEAMTHASPTIAAIYGVQQLILATQSGLISLDPLTGLLLWRFGYPFTYSTSLAVTPVVYDDMIFVSGHYTMASLVVRATVSNEVWTATRLWSNHNADSHWMTPVARDGFLYGPFGSERFNSQLKCVDMRTGAVKWSGPNYGRGATILVDDHLISVTEDNEVVLVKPMTNAYVELARFTAIPGYHDFTNKCWNAPAFSDGKLFVRSTAFVASFDLSVPGLRVETPQFSSPSALNLSIRTVNGTPVDSNRLTSLEVRATTTPTLAVTQWSKLTNSLVLTGGVVRVQNIGAGTNAQRYFIVSEPK